MKVYSAQVAVLSYNDEGYNPTDEFSTEGIFSSKEAAEIFARKQAFKFLFSIYGDIESFYNDFGLFGYKTIIPKDQKLSDMTWDDIPDEYMEKIIKKFYSVQEFIVDNKKE